jgi:hypothetical protein
MAGGAKGMNESEFRDWARRAQGDFNERLKALEKKVGAISLAPPRVRTPEAHERIGDLFLRLKENLASEGVTALGVSTVGVDGEVRTGWATEPVDRFALAGAVSQLWLEIMDRPPEKERVEDEAAGAASGSAGGQTDEGNPPGREAHGLAGPAPAAEA